MSKEIDIDQAKKEIAQTVRETMKEEYDKKVEEAKKQDDQKKEKPYAVCDNCRRILTKTEYDQPSCRHCGSTKATLINWDPTAT